jgi:hypothetical protein
MRDAHWPSGAYAAEFDDEARFVGATHALERHGYVKVETYAPYPVSGVVASPPDEASRLPVAVFAAGVAGAIAGYGIQWFANAVSYRLNIGGRPAHATPAFMIPTFEATVLFAALAAFVGFFWILGFPRPWHPMFEADGFERATNDRFWIAIDATDDEADPRATPSTLEALDAIRVVRVPPLA